MIPAFIKVYPFFTWLGSLIILVGILITMAAYRGKAGERYRVTNHFISELGEVGVSRFAVVFNIAMILGGLCYLPMMISLGTLLPGLWGTLGMLAGIIAAIACIFVGIFPMSNLKPHRVAAMTYFRMGLLTVLLITIAVFTQPAGLRVVPFWVNIFSILALAVYTGFLVTVGKKMDNQGNQNYILDPSIMPDRPKVWRTAVLEWLVFAFTILWFLVLVVAA